MKPDLLRRQRALEKTLAKYRGKEFEWGKADCVLMARSHLIAMGHKGLPKAPNYKDAKGAKKALKAIGHSSVAALLDAHLPRISPAFVLAGDIVTLKGDTALDAIGISLGFKIACWHDNSPELVNLIVNGNDIKAAWRA